MAEFSVDVDATAVLAMFGRATEAVGPRLKREALYTANRIALDARRRVAVLTGKTQEGIVVEETHAGDGYAVVALRQPMPNVPLWLEKGTVHMDAQPFFDVAAQVEQGPHLRRVAEALTDELEGLGDGR